ncbi:MULTISPECIES: hypothetical protein [unclassified Roseivivax]|uniref:hypothetical protein n=1 Tax=unclassified Roseivivax TaxID=2639302 RepID=UPI00126949A1|nr:MULTISPECIES: hypothetical protein [unclassified Roseivivax]
MSQLLIRGYIAALAPQGAPNLDIIVSSADGTRQAGIQVKTRRLSKTKNWTMSKKNEEFCSPSVYYCLVQLAADALEKPEVFIVPSSVVADLLYRSHRSWLNLTSLDGKKRTDTNRRSLDWDFSRIFREEDTGFGAGWLEQYRDNWAQLHVSTS